MKDDPAGTRQKCASSLSVVESRQNRRPRRLSVPLAAQNPPSLSDLITSTGIVDHFMM